MSNYLIFSIVLSVLLIIPFINSIFCNKPTVRMFIFKKILDVLIPLCLFIAVVIFESSKEEIVGYSNFPCVPLLLSLFNILLFLIQMILFKKEDKALTISVYAIYLSLLIGLILNFATVYYSLYTINSNYFSNVPGTTLEKAFEFIYFTFMVMITYSGDSISAVCIIPKMVQMLQVCICYLYLADIISILVKSKRSHN